MNPSIAVVMSDIFLRRLSPALTRLARNGAQFRILDIYRPFPQISSFLTANRPRVLLTEWLPGITRRIFQLGIPTVCIGDSGAPARKTVQLDVDDYAIGTTAAHYFLDAGYRHFAFAGLNLPYSSQREAGFVAALKKRNLPCSVFHVKEASRHHYMEIWEGPSRELRDWLEAQPKPLAVFAAHDPLGREICEAANAVEQHSVPERISVLGANDDALICPLSRPPLSSIEIPWDRIGESACEAIESLLARKKVPASPLLFSPGAVVERQSTSLISVEDPLLRRAIAYLRSRFPESINISTVCAELRISRRTLERRFDAHLGCTPSELLCRIRVDRAKSLLLISDDSISRIAERCGFGDGERFAVAFKRLTGTTPSGFRRGVTITQ